MSDGITVVGYSRCGTCRKARKWLDERGVAYTWRENVDEPPTAGELADWAARSGAPLRKFFNTSGRLYRELGVKARLDAGMTDDETIELLASDAMLVKRPILLVGDQVLIGFREPSWEEALAG